MKLLVVERSALLARRPGSDGRGQSATDIPQATLEAVARLTHQGWHIVLASHQANLARGLLEMSTVNGEHRKLARQVEEAGGRIDAVAICPHAPDAGCDCRMPQPGMIVDLIKRFETTPAATRMIATSGVAVAAGLAAGCVTWRLKSEEKQDDGAGEPVPLVADMDEVAARLLATNEAADGAPAGGPPPGA